MSQLKQLPFFGVIAEPHCYINIFYLLLAFPSLFGQWRVSAITTAAPPTGIAASPSQLRKSGCYGRVHAYSGPACIEL